MQIENFSLVRFLPLNIKDIESIEEVLLEIDNAIQYGEDMDVKIRVSFQKQFGQTFIYLQCNLKSIKCVNQTFEYLFTIDKTLLEM